MINYQIICVPMPGLLRGRRHDVPWNYGCWTLLTNSAHSAGFKYITSYIWTRLNISDYEWMKTLIDYKPQINKNVLYYHRCSVRRVKDALHWSLLNWPNDSIGQPCGSPTCRRIRWISVGNVGQSVPMK